MKSSHLLLRLCLVTCLLLLSATTSLWGRDVLRERFVWQNQIMPQEKVHVMTDRNVYVGGDTVWLRPFIVDGLTLRPARFSRFLYVELRNQTDSLVSRVKLHQRPEAGDTLMQGYLPLDMMLPTGVYTLVAYTQWMLNCGEEFFFKRNLQVVNASDLETGHYPAALYSYAGHDAWHRVDTTALRVADQYEGRVVPAIVTDKPRYGQRQRVTVRVQAPAGSVLSVAVTDDAGSPVDTSLALHRTLLSMPYIHDSLQLAAGHLRWPNIEPERSQSVAGLVRGYLREKPIPGLEVSLVAPRTMYSETALTDVDGDFAFSDFDFPDSTSFFLKTNNEKGKVRGEIVLAPNLLPEQVHHLEVPQAPDPQFVPADSTFFAGLYQRMKYNNGQWEVLLNDISVVTRKRKKQPVDIVSRFAQSSLSAEYIEQNRGMSLESMLVRLRGVSVSRGTAYYRREPLCFAIDNVVVQIPDEGGFGSITQLQFMEDICPTTIIDYIDLVNTSLVSVAGRTNVQRYCVRIQTLKDLHYGEPVSFITTHTPLGYQHHASFAPVRYADRVRIDGSDQRSTLYWNPLLVADSQGQASFEFWTNDVRTTSYTIRVEGVTDEGQLIDGTARVMTE